MNLKLYNTWNLKGGGAINFGRSSFYSFSKRYGVPGNRFVPNQKFHELTNYKDRTRRREKMLQCCIFIYYRRLTIEERRRGHCRGLVERELQRGAWGQGNRRHRRSSPTQLASTRRIQQAQSSRCWIVLAPHLNSNWNRLFGWEALLGDWKRIQGASSWNDVVTGWKRRWKWKTLINERERRGQ